MQTDEYTDLFKAVCLKVKLAAGVLNPIYGLEFSKIMQNV